MERFGCFRAQLYHNPNPVAILLHNVQNLYSMSVALSKKVITPECLNGHSKQYMNTCDIDMVSVGSVVENNSSKVSVVPYSHLKLTETVSEPAMPAHYLISDSLLSLIKNPPERQAVGDSAIALDVQLNIIGIMKKSLNFAHDR